MQQSASVKPGKAVLKQVEQRTQLDSKGWDMCELFSTLRRTYEYCARGSVAVRERAQLACADWVLGQGGEHGEEPTCDAPDARVVYGLSHAPGYFIGCPENAPPVGVPSTGSTSLVALTIAVHTLLLLWSLDNPNPGCS